MKTYTYTYTHVQFSGLLLSRLELFAGVSSIVGLIDELGYRFVNELDYLLEAGHADEFNKVCLGTWSDVCGCVCECVLGVRGCVPHRACGSSQMCVDVYVSVFWGFVDE